VLLVVVVVVVESVDLVSVGFDPLSQPVNTAPITSPISTIKVDIRFIRGIPLRKSDGLTRKIFYKIQDARYIRIRRPD